jgi:hypothetical protein
MRVKLGKGTEEFQMFMDFWDMMQAVWGIEDTNEYNVEATKEMEKFLAKHKSPFAGDLVRCLLNELNRRKQRMERNE